MPSLYLLACFMWRFVFVVIPSTACPFRGLPREVQVWCRFVFGCNSYGFRTT
uniref:Uncharacterized protein n=1 Tax=Setaria italica TaxID=4555 RepID=K3ZBT1_SETIT